MTASPPPGRLWLLLLWRRLPAWSALLLLSFVVLYPILLLFNRSFFSGEGLSAGQYGLDAWRFALDDTGMLSAARNTLALVLAREALSFPVAIGAAWLIARADVPARRLVETLFWIAFFLPLAPVTQAWILLAHPSAGLLNEPFQWLFSIQRGPFNIYSFWGIVWVHLLTSAIPLKVILLIPAFRNIDPAIEESSWVSGAGRIRTLLSVTLPALTPTMLIVSLLSVIRAFQSVEIELLLGLPIRLFIFGSKVIDLTFTEPPEMPAATALSAMVMIALVPLIYLQRWASMRRHYASLTSQYRPPQVRLGRWRWPLFAALAAVGVVATVVPFALLLMGSFMKIFGWYDVPTGAWTLRNWARVFGDPALPRAFGNTLVLGIGGATASTLLTVTVAYAIVRGRSSLRGLLDFVSWLPATITGVMLSLAWLLVLLQTPFLRPLYGTLLGLGLVATLGNVTLGVQLAKAGLMQIGRELEDAASLAGAGRRMVFSRIVVPLMAPVLATVWMIQFALTAGSAAMFDFLASRPNAPLAVVQLQQVGTGRTEVAAIYGLVLVVLLGAAAGGTRALVDRVGLAKAALHDGPDAQRGEGQ